MIDGRRVCSRWRIQNVPKATARRRQAEEQQRHVLELVKQGGAPEESQRFGVQGGIVLSNRSTA
jgi:hypothetical protein